MAPAKKRETRENQFYDVGVQGRKTGITLEDRGVRDEHGLEPISGIFSSPEKSPPKRTSSRTGGTLTESEPMDLTSPVPQPAASATKLLRSARTHLPPPKARSPMKTALGSSPRRQASIGPPTRSNPTTDSPSRAASHPAVGRRLDFEHEELSLQETPTLSGSGQRRGLRRSVYSIEPSPSRITSSAMMEESIQEEITAGEESSIFNGLAEESGLQEVGHDIVSDVEAEVAAETGEDTDTSAGAGAETLLAVAESEVVPVKGPAKRGRKRKSDAAEPSQVEEEAPAPRKRGRKPLEKKDKNSVATPALPSRRSKRVSDITEQEPSNVEDTSAAAVEELQETPVVPKPRGRPPKAPTHLEKPPPAKRQKRLGKELEKGEEEPVFKRPKTVAKANKKADANAVEVRPDHNSIENGKLVDLYGHPISKADLDQLSTTTTGSRFGRGRHLSVFRELEPDTAATVGRTGRHRVKPINFWANEAVSYDPKGNMQAIVNRVFEEPPPKRYKKSGRGRGPKRSLSAIEEEDDDDVGVQPWEEEGGGEFVGSYKGFDAANKVSTDKLIHTTIAWSDRGIKPTDIPDGSFKFIKLASGHVNDDDKGKTFLSWGFLELAENQMKRAKNSSNMHMVFHVQSGAVEIKVHENELIVRRGGVFQVPRGNMYSIRNVGSKTSRLFYAQGCEMRVYVEG
ncbi:hypothetical protein BU23DRAFT_557070 [Bimuria novae-zelandiae CBS 107.79]|uniref:CENP-C homolog n=1 Tax=Bimuria novae-zelandiae CBS 107.79 TaxID=1447943 RepID=A0A6A5V1R0_9PLEO|nr:hypothetical protein BU23DRAFT_557070 [Bimuria novae-zelandiae CBS 107.79]